MQSGRSVWRTSCRNATEVAMATEWLTEWIGCLRRHMLNAERGCLCHRFVPERGRRKGVDLCGRGWLLQHNQRWSTAVEFKLR